MITGLNTIFFWVTSIDDSLSWWRAFGVEPGERFGTWQDMQVPGTVTFALHEDPEQRTGINAVLAFSVGELATEIERLASVGISPTGAIANAGTRSFATFKDPDGNQVQLSQLNR